MRMAEKKPKQKCFRNFHKHNILCLV